MGVELRNENSLEKEKFSNEKRGKRKNSVSYLMYGIEFSSIDRIR